MILFFFLFPLYVTHAASPLQISPTIIDEKVKAKDILKYNVKIKNLENQKYDIFVFVSDYSMENGAKRVTPSSNLDNKRSVASWTSIRRGFDIESNSEIEVPLEIDVSPVAEPGKYYALISITTGSNSTEAQGQINNGAAEIIIGIDVQDNIVEKMQSLEFKPAKNLFVKYPVDFNLSLKNTGNTELAPSGAIYIYDRDGHEIDKVDITDVKVAGEEKKDLALHWNGKGGFGKFKGRLEMEYGEKDKRDIQDVLYFWVFPTKFLIIFGGGLFVLTFLLTFLLFKRTYRTHRRHDNSYADDEIEVVEEEGVLDLRKK